MSSHEAFGAAGGAFFVILGLIFGILFIVLMYLALWGLYLSGRAQDKMAGTAEQVRQLVAFQTDYIQRLALAQEARAEQAKNHAGATAMAAEQLAKPHEVVILQSTD